MAASSDPGSKAKSRQWSWTREGQQKQQIYFHLDCRHISLESRGGGGVEVRKGEERQSRAEERVKELNELNGTDIRDDREKKNNLRGEKTNLGVFALFWLRLWKMFRRFIKPFTKTLI